MRRAPNGRPVCDCGEAVFPLLSTCWAHAAEPTRTTLRAMVFPNYRDALAACWARRAG